MGFLVLYMVFVFKIFVLVCNYTALCCILSSACEWLTLLLNVLLFLSSTNVVFVCWGRVSNFKVTNATLPIPVLIPESISLHLLIAWLTSLLFCVFSPVPEASSFLSRGFRISLVAHGFSSSSLCQVLQMRYQ